MGHPTTYPPIHPWSAWTEPFATGTVAFVQKEVLELVDERTKRSSKIKVKRPERVFQAGLVAEKIGSPVGVADRRGSEG